VDRIRWSSFGRKLIGVAVAATATLVVAGSVSAAAGASQSLLLRSSFAHITPPAGFLSLFSGSVGTVAGFEDDDANLVPDSATDWNSFSPTNWTGTAPYQQSTKVSAPWTFYGASDATDTRTDSGFAGGTKEDKVCPSVIGSNTPNKDDLARIYLAGENIGSHVYLMLAWVRIPQSSTSSDEHVAFEFNQGTTSCGGGSPLVQRTTGDLLVIYDFTSGGTPTFSLSKWVASGSCEVGADSAPCWGPQQTITAAEGAVNTSGAVSDTISPSSPIAATLGTSEFGEAGIDLTSATVGLSGGRACEKFGTASAVSRSSGSSSTAEMEDLVGPISVDLSNCVTPGISTTPSPSSGALGTHLNDTAQLSGGNIPTGNITFNLYGPADSTCAGTPLYTETDPVSTNSAATTGGPAAASAGTYHWTAAYGGDGNNNPASSTCADEAVTIAKASPAIGTTLSSSSVTVGDTVHDSAGLTGATSTAGGTVAYTVYTNDTCSAGARTAGTKGVTNGVVTDSDGLVFASAGTFYWQAVYSGDGNNNGATSACKSEILTVEKVTPTIATTLSATTGAVGDTVHDSATLSGATSNAGGTVIYTVYTNDTCSADARTAGTKGVTNGVVTDSDGLVFASAGTFYWQAVYSGDGNNNGATSACKSEILSIGKNGPTISTTLSADEVVIGSGVHDSAALHGATADAGGTVIYTVYSNNECSSGARDAGTKAVTSGVVTDSDSLTFPTAGTFYWQAVYSGDANNGGATSPCSEEQLTVDRPAIAITKNPKSQSVDSGGTASFTITVTNTGTVALTNVAVTDGLAPNCAKTIGALAPGQSTSYTCTLGGVTSAFTNSATASGHPPVGPDVTATDTAPVTVNATPPPPSTPPAPPAPKIDLAIAKTATPSSSALGDRVTWTLTIKNNGPSGATGVTVADPIPAGMRYVSSTTTQGTCTGGVMLSCQLGSMASGASVTITLVTTSSATGTITNTATVVGNEAETNTANNTATAQTQVRGPFVPPVPLCTALGVTPKQLLVGHKSLLKMRVSRNGVPVKGIRVRIHGSTLSIVTARSNGKGLVTRTVRPLRPGIVVFRPVAQKGCRVTRIGVIGVFTPPVTG
jgi:uncharacterized repeat protein (TIGR01451 family)